MRQWLYPVNEAGEQWDGPPLAEYFRTAKRATDWYLTTSFRQMQPGDRIWIYGAAPYSRVVATGFVELGPELRVGIDGVLRWQIDIRWDERANRRLLKNSAAGQVDVPPRNVRPAHPAEIRRFVADVEHKNYLGDLPKGRLKQLREVTVRQGQPDFRAALLRAYDGACAISGCTAPQALQAAHIEPYNGRATNLPSNGLLLRADLHNMFDAGLLWLDDDYRVRIAPEVEDSGYLKLVGKQISLPAVLSERPSKRAIRAHRSNHP